MVFGTLSNTYVLPGVTSAASTAAQSGPLYVVTSDGSGRLAAMDIASLGTGGVPGLQGQLDALRVRDDALAEGIAMSFALDVPDLSPSRNIAITANWGHFDEQNGVAAGFAARINRNVSLNGGVAAGLNDGQVGGKAGLRFEW